MRSLFATLRTLVLPGGSRPGTARIVIGPDLPPPLDTYALAFARIIAANIVWYGTDPTGTDGDFIADLLVEYPSPPPVISEIIRCHVIGGAVVEYAPGFPMGQVWHSSAGAAQLRYTTVADTIDMTSTQTLALSGDTSASLVGLGNGRLVIDSAGTLLTTPPNTIMNIQASEGITMQSASGTDDVVIASGRDVYLSGTETHIDGTIDWGGSAARDATTLTSQGTASTAYVQLATITGQSFVAPPSGKIMVHWMLALENSLAGGDAVCTFQIRDGSTIGAGTLFMAANDLRAVRKPGIARESRTGIWPVDSLTPGAAYNVELLFRSTSGANTATFLNRNVGVVPTFG